MLRLEKPREMVMGKGKKGSSRPDYEKLNKLIYFRWKALIRSNEYREFYQEKVKELLKRKDNLFFAEVELHGLEYGFMNEEYKELSSEVKDLEDEESEILSEAQDKFGLIASGAEDLKPIDHPVERLRITFKDYLPAMPDGSSTRRFYEKWAVREVKYKNGELLIVNRNREEKFFPCSNLRLVRIDTDMPFGLVIESLKKKLMADTEMRRSDRKEFDSWEEALKVWDIEQQEDNYLKTAKRMEWTLNRKSNEYTDEDLRSLVSKKLPVAKELISLAGQGKFKTL